MPYIKELVIHGFKSFARETKIPFKNTMNVIVGPNGSGKSNITDAICFVLGRLGSKSMRAKRLSNLLFAGTHQYKPSPEASVEMIFDNSDKGFSLAAKEVSIKRVLRRSGQGVYKINNEIKTRQEILELLAQAGIDPNGFNIILQGEIDSFVKMPAEQRREVIEEVAGISIYEVRKQRSLKELEKTDQRLKEVEAILRERTAYLRNLEQERKQALKFQKLQEEIRDCKASILHKTANEKQEKIDSINKEISSHQAEISKINSLIDKTTHEISVLNEKILHITENIQKASGLEQEKLNTEISDLRAEIAGLTIKKQSAQSHIDEMQARKAEIQESIEISEKEIREMSSSKSKGKEKNLKEEIGRKKAQIEQIEEQRRKLYITKSQLSTLNSRVEDKKVQVQKAKHEADFILNRIEEMEALIKIKDSLEIQKEESAKLKIKFDRQKQEIAHFQSAKSELEKSNAALEMQISELEKIKSKVSSLDICPLCKTKITKEHVHDVVKESGEHQEKYKHQIHSNEEGIKNAAHKLAEISGELEAIENELRTRAQDILRLELINEKKNNLRKLSEEREIFEKELKELEAKQSSIEKQMLSLKTSEHSYDSIRLEVQELERRQEKDMGMEITLKQRDVDRLKNALRQAARDIEESSSELNEVSEQLEEKQNILDDKNEQDQDLKRRFQKTLAEKSQHQEKIRFFESDTLHKQSSKHLLEEKINNLKINRAEFLAQKESAEQEQAQFKNAKIMRMSVAELNEKLMQTQRILDTIGSVNMRSLEVYEDVKKEYDKVHEKADVLVKEKQEILMIIEDIDKKKKKVFLKTLSEINALFSRNFSQLSTKGQATLEPVNPEDIFAGGIEMLIKVGKGKYFDTHSLSGGEKSLVSLALIFAIQEYKPYSFYIFDEIDAALDRRNSERLANLLKRYMNNGQYIIVTHNDSLITEAPTIYGVSMQDKISNVLSLEV